MLPELLILKFNHVNLSYAWGNFKILNHCTEGTDCTFTLLTCIQLDGDFAKNSQVDTSRFYLRGDGGHKWNYWENMGEITYIKGSVVTKLSQRKKNNCCCLEIIILEFFVNQFGDLPAD